MRVLPLALLAAVLAAPPAHANVYGSRTVAPEFASTVFPYDLGVASGWTCGGHFVYDPTAENATYTGELQGGTVVFTSGDGEILCSVQVGDPHYGYGAASVYGGSGFVVHAAGAASYWASPGADVYVCTAWTTYGSGETRYYDAPSQTFVIDPGSAECALAAAVEL